MMIEIFFASARSRLIQYACVRQSTVTCPASWHRFQMRLQREAAGLERSRLAPDVIGRGGEAAPPMIKHAREMIDSIGLFDDPEEKIVVLRAVKFRTETIDLPQEIAPDDGEMADVVTGKKIIRRPIWFEDWRIEALFRELVFIGIDHVCVAMILKPFYILKKCVRLENIVVIEEAHPFAFGQGEASI